MIRSLFAALATLMLCIGGVARAAGPETQWRDYSNARFAFAACYPASTFKMEPPPAIDDGRSFYSRDGAELDVFGSYFGADGGLAKERADEERNVEGSINYRAAGTDWFVYSGSGRGKIFYNKTILRDGRFVSLAIKYPVAQRAKYDPIVRRMVACLKVFRPAF